MKQLYVNNFASALVGDIAAGDGILTVANGADLPAPAAGEFILLTLAALDSNGNEVAWEIVKVTTRVTNTLTVTRAQEGTAARLWPDGSLIEGRLTAGGMSGKEDSIAAGLSSQFWRGDKSWQDLAAAVRLVLLNGLGAGTNTPVVAADGLLAAIAKIQAQINARATLDSPVLTGTPKVPTAAAGDSSQLAANTAFVKAAVASAIAVLTNSAPAVLDTFYEFAAALGNDPDFAATMATALANKLDKTATAAAATKLATARSIALTGEVSGSGVFDGSGNLSIATSIVDSGWLTPTLINGWTHASGRPLRYRKYGNRVYFRGGVQTPVANNGTVCMNLPAGYKPLAIWVCAARGGAYTGSDAYATCLDIAVGGVQIGDAAAASTCYVFLDGVSFPLD